MLFMIELGVWYDTPMETLYVKEFDKWTVQKKILSGKAGATKYVKSGDVWWCALGVNIAHEQDGKDAEFVRPVLILKRFNQRLVLIVPLTHGTSQQNFAVSFTTRETHVLLVNQIRALSTNRLLRRAFRLPDRKFDSVRGEVFKILLAP
jgi:mRNA interferase MazF